MSVTRWGNLPQSGGVPLLYVFLLLLLMMSRDKNFFFLLRVSPSLWLDFIPRSLSSFLSLMKEKKAKENQGDDRQHFFRTLRMMRSRDKKKFLLYSSGYTSRKKDQKGTPEQFRDALFLRAPTVDGKTFGNGLFSATHSCAKHLNSLEYTHRRHHRPPL